MIPLIHTTGFLTGTGLYGLLLWLSLRSHVASSEARTDRLPLITALLGLTWNMAALAALAAGHLGQLTPVWLASVAYSALGFLPAVVIHSVIRRSDPSRFRWIITAGYLIAVLGALFQGVAWNDLASGGQALRGTTLGFVALTPFLAWATRRTGRAWWIAAFSVFAASGIHMSDLGVDHYSWGAELLGHHASLPLAFAILIYDYRFAFGDIFLKRALTVVTLVGFAGGVGFLASRFGWLEGPSAYLVVVATSLATAVVSAPLTRTVSRLVDRWVLHRPDYADIRGVLSARFAAAESEDEVLATLVSELGTAFMARESTWSAVPAGATGGVSLSDGGSRVRAIVAAAVEPQYEAVFSRLEAGRRFLSDDFELVAWGCAVAARRIDALRIAHERCLRDAREQEMTRLATQAELRALRAQINPHFLFNALNTIGYLIRTAPDRAWSTLMLLTELLRASLRSNSPLVHLDDELRLIRSYLEIEKARFEERLKIAYDIDAGLERRRVPPFIIQPLVENSIKHSVARNREGGAILVRARAGSDGELVLEVQDSGRAASEIEIRRGMKDGVGLRNIRERLRVYYGEAASFSLSASEEGALATIRIPAAADTLSSHGEAI